MVVNDVGIHNIMGGMENTAGVRLHNHRRKLKQRFDIIRKLGQGTYGKVQLGINKETGQEVAIKTIKKAKIETEADLVRIRREIQIMSSVQHPNIIHIYEVFENREKMVLVMEYAAGGELYDYLSERKVLSEQEARRIFRQIATAVYYCHKHKICHRDLKLENILLDEHGSAKIADFGLSNVFDEQRLLNTFCGSPLYASPEIVKGTPYHGPEVDCWSLGVLLYTLVYGAMPFDGSNFKRLVKQISHGDYFEPKKPSPASPLIRHMLTVPPTRRADIEKICAHWWVNEDYSESCLDIAEELANQTPVRLDLLLSLAPPAPSVGSDKLLITKEQGSTDGTTIGASMVPARCHSVGSLMELDHPSVERRIGGFEKDGLVQAEINTESSKRKLEEGISTEEANQASSKRKERSRRRERDRSQDRRHHRSSSRSKNPAEAFNKNSLESKDQSVKCEQSEEMMDVETDGRSFALEYIDTSLRESEETVTGSVKAAASSMETIAGSTGEVVEPEHLEVALKSPTKEKGGRKSVKKKGKTGDEPEISDKSSAETPDEKENSIPSLIEGDIKQEVNSKVRRKKQIISDTKVDDPVEDPGEKEMLIDTGPKEDELIKEVNGHSAQNLQDDHARAKIELNGTASPLECNVEGQVRVSSKPVEMPKKGVRAKSNKGELSLGKLGSSSEKSSGADTPEDKTFPPSRPMERRRSKIFETAEKFNCLLSGSSEPKSPTIEKPKKVFIPGVKVSDAKRAFERKSSLPEPIIVVSNKTSVPKKSFETSSDATLKEISQVSNEVSSAERGEKVPIESVSSADGKNLDHNGTKSNELKVQQPSVSDKGSEKMHADANGVECKQEEEDSNLQLIPALPVTDKSAQQEEARIKKLKDAVEIISNAIAEESKRDSLPDSVKKISSSKPPVPAALDTKGRPKGPTSPKSPPRSPLDPATGKKMVRVQVAPNEVRLATIQVSTPEATKFPFNENDITKVEEINGSAEDVISEKVANKDSKSIEDGVGKKKSAKVEITLKSATLPRRKTSKAEIQLGSPHVPPVEFKTEVEHMVGAALRNTKPKQRSEVAFPIAGGPLKTLPFRSVSAEPDDVSRTKPRERIIPIKLEDSSSDEHRVCSPPPARPPVPPLQQQRSLSQSQRSGSLSRQSTLDSDTEGLDTIHKSPREFIIPIAVEGGGYVTPRAGSLEPSASDESTSKPRQRSSSRFGRLRRMSSLLSDASEDEGFNSPFATLRHSSLSREDDDDKSFHMHRLRSSRPSRHPLEHADSLSSAEEEEDDDDGFEILTAESLFSTLLSRVRSLTQRLNVEDSTRPGFPSSRLMSQLKTIGHTSPSSFWNNVYAHQQEPLSRRLSESSQFSRSFSRDSELGSTPWRRSVSRDVSDCDSVYSETSSTTGAHPRGAARQEDCGMCDEVGSEGNNASSSFPSHYTPSLARRISQHHQHHLTDEELVGQNYHDDRNLRRDYLPSYLQTDNHHYVPSSSRRLARTLSVRSATEDRSVSRRRDLVPARRLSFLESRDLRNIGELYNKSSFHGSSHSDIYDYKKRDYLPPTRHTLRLLDNNTTSGLNHKGSSASDTGDYCSQKSWEANSVLPPLPHTAPVFTRRKDAAISRSYGRQRSVDVLDTSYISHFNRPIPTIISETTNEDIHDCPKHSASLPSVVGGKVSGSRFKGGTYLPVSGYNQKDRKADQQPNSSMDEGKKSNNTVSNPDKIYLSERNSASEIDHLKEKDSEKMNSRQIPSLLRFRSSSLCHESGTSKLKNVSSVQDLTSSQSTPDRSVLSKFFQQDSEDRSSNKYNISKENKESTDERKKNRRISRFLRPDFFDTPREESSFVKEKEAQKAAEEERKKAKRIARRAALLEKKEKEAQKMLNSKEMPKMQSSLVKDSSNSDTQSTNVDISQQAVKSDPEDNHDKKDCNKPSDFIAPSNHEEFSQEKEITAANNKNRFLHSLEKKWEKFRSSSDDTNSSATSGKSRVEKAIRLLRERSVAPRGSDLMTSESNLLKRAVSVDDLCVKTNIQVTKGNNSSSGKLGCKVSSVLGMFRKLEDSPADTQKLSQGVNRPSVLLSSLRRTQSVYAGSHSDSVLAAHSKEIFEPSSTDLSGTQPKGDSHESVEDNVIQNSEIMTPADLPIENVVHSASASTFMETNQKNITIPVPVCVKSETPDRKISKKIKRDYKVVKDESLKKECASKQKKQAGSSETSDTTEKSAVIKKVHPKKAISKVALNTSDVKKVKVPLTSNTSKDSVMNIQECVAKSNLKKVIPQKKLSHNEKKEEEIQLENKNTVFPSLSGVASQGTLDNSETKMKPSGSVEINEKSPNLDQDVGVAQCIDTTGKTIVQESVYNGEYVENSCETTKPEPKVNCKNIPISLSMNHDETNQENFVPEDKNSIIFECESSKKDSQGAMNSGELKVAVVKKLEGPQPSHDTVIPVPPVDECESLDSWSVCSDFESRDFSISPLPYPNLEGEEMESVEDRIRRKSFYSRFNDSKKKSHRKLSPSYIATHHYKKQGNPSIHSQQEVGYDVAPYSRKLPLLTRSHSAVSNSISTDGATQSYEFHNGFDDGLLEQRKASLDENMKSNEDKLEEKTLDQDSSSVINSERLLSQPEGYTALKSSSSHLLRPTDFTQDILRRSSLTTKSRLPTALWERRASTPVGSRLAIVNNKRAKAGSQADSTAPRRETLPLDGKYDRFNSKSAPTSILE